MRMIIIGLMTSSKNSLKIRGQVEEEVKDDAAVEKVEFEGAIRLNQRCNVPKRSLSVEAA
jgi:hypothetical protein